MKKVMIFGTFDCLHPGHEFVLQEAQKHGNVTVVIARTGNVERIKGRSPMESEADRIAAIQKRFPAVTILLGETNDFLAPVRRVQPDLILLGYDQKLPPGVFEAQLAPANVLRLPAHEPERYKSSLLRK